MSSSRLTSPAPRRFMLGRLLVAAFALLFVAAGATVTAASASADTPPVSDFTIQTLFDGATAPNKLDASKNNNTVATNDTVGFAWGFTAADDLSDATFEQTLPAGWSWNASTITALSSDSSLYQSSATISADGRTLTATLSTSAGNTILLQTLTAHPDFTVSNGSTYTPVVTATSAGSAPVTTQTNPITVVSAPEADLAKTVSQKPKPLTVGGVAGYSAIFNLTASISSGQIGAESGVTLASPLTISDSFTGLSGATATIVSPATGATLAQSGNSLTVTLTGATVNSATSATVKVMLWWPDSVIPLAPSQPAVNVSNTATPVGWTDTNGAAVVETNTANNTANVSLQQSASGGAGAGPSYAKDLWVAKDATPNFGKEPSADPTDWQSVATNQPVGENATVMARFSFTASLNPDGTSLGSTDLSAYDFWNPAEQRLIDNGTGEYVGDDTNTALSPSEYTIQYTDGTTIAGPWVDSVGAAGGVASISGIRYVIDGNYALGKTGSQARLVATAAFVAIAPPSQKSVSDVAWFTSDRAADNKVSVGNSYIIENTVLGLTKSANKTSLTSGGTVTYTLTPTINPPAGSITSTTTNLTVTDLLPTNVDTVSTSGLDPYWSVSQTASAGGQITLTFIHNGAVSTTDTVPPISYTATTDVQAPANGSMTNTATATATAAAPATAKNSVAVLQADVITQTKTTSTPTIQIGAKSATWQISWFNFVNESQGTSYFVDVLPYSGDGRGTNYNGTAILQSAVVTATSPAGATVQYSTDPAATIAGRAANDPNTTWTNLGTTDPSTIPGITALRVVVSNFLEGTPGIGHLDVTLALSGEKTGDVYGNTSKGYIGAAARPLGDTKIATVTVISSTITGTVINDKNDNGVADSGEPGIGGASVQLLDTAGNVVASTVTASDGSYAFVAIPAGTYSVSVDPSSLPPAMSETFDHDGTLNNNSGEVTVADSSVVSGIDFGYFQIVANGGKTPNPGNGNTTGTTGSGTTGNGLAFTGTNAEPLLLFGFLVLLIGAALVVAGRLRSQTAKRGE